MDVKRLVSNGKNMDDTIGYYKQLKAIFTNYPAKLIGKLKASLSPSEIIFKQSCSVIAAPVWSTCWRR